MHTTNQLGVKWGEITTEVLARMIAACHVEQRLLLRAARDARLITTDQYDRYLGFNCEADLKLVSPHALTAREYFATVSQDDQPLFFERRVVKIGNRSILLPVGYIKAIIDLLNDDRITINRAAELAMMNHYAFQERFGPLIHQTA